MVTSKSLAIAKRLHLTAAKMRFIEESAMLHDIGIIHVHAPDIGCHGTDAYVTHALRGAEILRKEGFSRHAQLVERHMGVGISKQEVIRQQLPLPKRDMIPKTLEERIVSYADLFFSKNDEFLFLPRTPALIKRWLSKFGAEHVERFKAWQYALGK